MNSILKDIKKDIIRLPYYSHASHVGAALSVVDILYVIYTKIANITLSNVASLDRDKVILSKAHSSSALYSTLAHLGFLPKEVLEKYYIDDGILPAHLDKTTFPIIDCSAGSLGHGLSIGIGMALADPKHNVYVVMGDGECNEGSVWEAIMFCGHNKISNLTIAIDFNRMQAFGFGKDIIDQENLSARFSSFGLDAYDEDGHDLEKIENVLKKKSNRTKAIVFHTVKGHGVSYMENQLLWHYRNPNEEQYQRAIKDIENA